MEILRTHVEATQRKVSSLFRVEQVADISRGRNKEHPMSRGEPGHHIVPALPKILPIVHRERKKTHGSHSSTETALLRVLPAQNALRFREVWARAAKLDAIYTFFGGGPLLSVNYTRRSCTSGSIQPQTPECRAT